MLEGNTKDIEAVANLIEPAVKKTKGQAGDRLENTVKANVCMIVDYLKNCKALKNLVEQNKLCIRGGYYSFYTGKVEMLNEEKK